MPISLLKSSGTHTYLFYKLASASLCENVGENAALPPDVGDLNWDTNTIEPIPYDLGLGNRIVGISVDMGAYEVYIAPPPPPPPPPPQESEE